MTEYDSFTSLLFDSAQGEFDRADVVLEIRHYDNELIARHKDEGVLGNFPITDTFKEMLDNAGFQVTKS